MTKIFWQTFIWITTLCCLATTARISVLGNSAFERKSYVILSPFWLLVLIVWGPVMIGAFVRGEISAVPWVAFNDRFPKHGFADSMLSSFIVLTIDLWLFWVPSHIYITSKQPEEVPNSIFIRLFNITLGALLTTQLNPLYLLIEKID